MAEPAETALRLHRGGSGAVTLAERIWHGRGNGAVLARLALGPAELLFRAAAGAHHLAYDTGTRRASAVHVPVISIGSLTVGGAGKTPLTGWIVDRLLERGARPAVLHGGYAEDEPALHRAMRPSVPVYVGRDRVAGARQAAAAGSDVVVLDDGFQHRRLARSLDIVLVAAEQWQARPRLLPAGGWRETPRALRRADLVIVTRKSASASLADRVAGEVTRWAAVPVVRVRLAPAGWRVRGAATSAPAGEAVLVTAVADWEPVAAHAREAGAQIGEAVVFPDHHAFDEADVERLVRLVGRRSIVTTAKDAVKLRRFRRMEDVFVLDLRVEAEAGGEAIEQALDRVLALR